MIQVVSHPQQGQQRRLQWLLIQLFRKKRKISRKQIELIICRAFFLSSVLITKHFHDSFRLSHSSWLFFLIWEIVTAIWYNHRFEFIGNKKFSTFLLKKISLRANEDSTYKIGAQLSEARENGNLSFAIDFSFTSDQRMRGLLELCKPVTEGDKPKPVQCWIIVDTQ